MIQLSIHITEYFIVHFHSLTNLSTSLAAGRCSQQWVRAHICVCVCMHAYAVNLKGTMNSLRVLQLARGHAIRDSNMRRRGDILNFH